MHVDADFHDDGLRMVRTTKDDVTDVKDAIVNQSTIALLFIAIAGALDPPSQWNDSFGNISLDCS